MMAVMAKAIFRRPSMLVLRTRRMCWNFSGMTSDCGDGDKGMGTKGRGQRDGDGHQMTVTKGWGQRNRDGHFGVHGDGGEEKPRGWVALGG